MAGFTGAALINLLSLAGLANSFVEWRCFLQLDHIIATYQAAKAFLFGFFPFHIPGWVKDYAIVTASFSASLSANPRGGGGARTDLWTAHNSASALG